MPSFMKTVKKQVGKAKNAVEKTLNVDLDGDGAVGKKNKQKNGYDRPYESFSTPPTYSFTGPSTSGGGHSGQQLPQSHSYPAMSQYQTQTHSYPTQTHSYQAPSAPPLPSAPPAAPSSSNSNSQNANPYPSEKPVTQGPIPISSSQSIDSHQGQDVPTGNLLPMPVAPPDVPYASGGNSLPYPVVPPAPAPSQMNAQNTPYPMYTTSSLPEPPKPTPPSGPVKSQYSQAEPQQLSAVSSPSGPVTTHGSHSHPMPAAQPPPNQNQQDMFKIVVPANCYGGMNIRIQTPDGSMADVRLPAGVTPGQEVLIRLPAKSSSFQMQPNLSTPWPEWRSYNGRQYVPSRLGVVRVPTHQPTPRATGRKKALLVGINYYNTKAQLRGCVNDVQNMKKWLIQQGFSDSPSTMLVLTDDEASPKYAPTRANIMRGMQWLTEGIGPGDSLFFHFSGHGSQEVDKTGAESDGLNETICPVDFKRAGMISDDVIWDILVYGLPDGCRLTALMDCCHSGTGMDLPFTYDDRRRSWVQDTNPSNAKGDVILLSGCEDDQCSIDTYDKRKGAGGAMTHAFLSANEKLQFPTFAQLLLEIQTQLRRQRYSQRPKLSTSQTFNVHERIFELSEGIESNKNPEVGRMVRHHHKPQYDYGGFDNGVGNMMAVGAGAFLLGSMLDF